MVQWIKCLARNSGDRSSDPQDEAGVAVAHNPSI